MPISQNNVPEPLDVIGGIENDLHYVLDVNFYQDRTQCKNANYLQNRVLLNKWALGMIRKLQKEEETETGKEAKSVKRIMAKSCSLRRLLWRRWPH